MFWRASGPPRGVEPIPRVSRLTPPSQVPVERLRLTVLRRLNGLLAGDHAGLFPGHGTERGEARPYVPGDDPRHLDWAVTARTQEPHVRDMVADHELDVWIVLDLDRNVHVGSGVDSTEETRGSAAASLARHFLLENRAVGLRPPHPDGDGGRHDSGKQRGVLKAAAQRQP